MNKVHLASEQLEKIVQGLDKAMVHIRYLLANHKLSFIDESSLLALQTEIQDEIDNLKSLILPTETK